MEQEKDEANPRKRKEAPNFAASATALDGPPADIQDREPQAKVSRGELQKAGRKSLVAGSHFLQHLKGPCPRVRIHPLTSLNSALLFVPPSPGSLHSLKLT